MKRSFFFLLALLALLTCLTGCAKNEKFQLVIDKVMEGRDTSDKSNARFTEDDLAGTWVSAYRENDKINCRSYTFDEDGSVQVGSVYYEYYEEGNSLGISEGWSTPPMGFPQDLGSYSLDGAKLTLSLKGEFDDADSEPFESQVRILSVTEDTLELDDEFGTYLRAETAEDFEALCRQLNVSLSIPQ